MMQRILADLAICIALLVFPWWVGFVLACIAFFLFEDFYEVILFGLIIDSLYQISIARYFHFELFFTAFAIVLFIAGFYIKKKLKFYSLG